MCMCVCVWGGVCECVCEVLRKAVNEALYCICFK